MIYGFASCGYTRKKRLKQPEVVRRFEEISFTPVGDTPEAFGAFVKAEIEKWGKIVRELGLSAD